MTDRRITIERMRRFSSLPSRQHEAIASLPKPESLALHLDIRMHRHGLQLANCGLVRSTGRTRTISQDKHTVPASDNRLGSCNAACGRYRRRPQNGSLGRGAGHPSAELSLGSRGVMNRRTLSDMGFACADRAGIAECARIDQRR